MRRKHINNQSVNIPSPRQPDMPDENDRVIVNMNVSDDSNFLSVFSVTDKPVISTEVAEFIEFSTQLLLPNTDITLRIHSNCIDENEKRIYAIAMKEFYREQYIVTGKEQKRNNITAALFVFTGILCLGLMFATEHIFISAVWSEIIDIVAWVFLWEAVDIFFFQNRKLKARKTRCTSFMNMNIEYWKIENK